MTSHPRRGSGPVRQHSLQQPPRRHHQVRRQRSAEEDRTLQIRTTDPIRARREAERANVERPKVRIAWGDDARIADDDSDNRVEVVACQIATAGKSRPINSGKQQPRIIGRNLANDKTCSTLLYSRQELAERLRLAWKQREANKSNIDVFLAHGTTEERSESRLSSSSSAERSPARSSPTPQRICENNNINCNNETIDKITDNNESKSAQNSIISNINPSRLENSISACDNVKNKRASFKSCTNTAFLELANDSDGGLSTSEVPVMKKELSQLNNNAAFNNELKTRRNNSAPPQRRANSVGASSRTQVSIVIEAPSICKPDKDLEVSSACVETNSFISKNSTLAGRSIKSAPAKRRARSGKRRANSVAGKDLEAGRAKVEAKNSEVVTMVSLVSDADSDSEIEENSPRDDKLISQLRSNLPTTPIIKNTVATCGSSNSIARRPIKSVSFQQDSFDVEETDKRSDRIRPQSVQVGRVIGSALPTPEEARSWTTEITTLTISTTSSTIRQRYESQDLAETSLTDREKRCLVVPIGDPRSDKKRKLLRTRSTPPQRMNGVEKQSTMHQNETREAPPRPRIPAPIENVLPVQQSTSILLQASVTKLVDDTNRNFKAGDEAGADAESVEPAFQTTKEKECWHLYRRMCDKGVCVSFDTVLRGMLTPTEYRLRRKEVT